MPPLPLLALVLALVLALLLSSPPLTLASPASPTSPPSSGGGGGGLTISPTPGTTTKSPVTSSPAAVTRAPTAPPTASTNLGEGITRSSRRIRTQQDCFIQGRGTNCDWSPVVVENDGNGHVCEPSKTFLGIGSAGADNDTCTGYVNTTRCVFTASYHCVNESTAVSPVSPVTTIACVEPLRWTLVSKIKRLFATYASIIGPIEEVIQRSAFCASRRTNVSCLEEKTAMTLCTWIPSDETPAKLSSNVTAVGIPTSAPSDTSAPSVNAPSPAGPANREEIQIVQLVAYPPAPYPQSPTPDVQRITVYDSTTVVPQPPLNSTRFVFTITTRSDRVVINNGWFKLITRGVDGATRTTGEIPWDASNVTMFNALQTLNLPLQWVSTPSLSATLDPLGRNQWTLYFVNSRELTDMELTLMNNLEMNNGQISLTNQPSGSVVLWSGEGSQVLVTRHARNRQLVRIIATLPMNLTDTPITFRLVYFYPGCSEVAPTLNCNLFGVPQYSDALPLFTQNVSEMYDAIDAIASLDYFAIDKATFSSTSTKQNPKQIQINRTFEIYFTTKTAVWEQAEFPLAITFSQPGDNDPGILPLILSGVSFSVDFIDEAPILHGELGFMQYCLVGSPLPGIFYLLDPQIFPNATGDPDDTVQQYTNGTKWRVRTSYVFSELNTTAVGLRPGDSVRLAGRFYTVSDVLVPVFGADATVDNLVYRINETIRTGMYLPFNDTSDVTDYNATTNATELGRMLVPRAVYRLTEAITLDFTLEAYTPSIAIPWWAFRGYGCRPIATSTSLEYDVDASAMQDVLDAAVVQDEVTQFLVTRTTTVPKPYPTSPFVSLFTFTGAYDYKVEARNVEQGALPLVTLSQNRLLPTTASANVTRVTFGTYPPNGRFRLAFCGYGGSESDMEQVWSSGFDVAPGQGGGCIAGTTICYTQELSLSPLDGRLPPASVVQTALLDMDNVADDSVEVTDIYANDDDTSGFVIGWQIRFKTDSTDLLSFTGAKPGLTADVPQLFVLSEQYLRGSDSRLEIATIQQGVGPLFDSRTIYEVAVYNDRSPCRPNATQRENDLTELNGDVDALRNLDTLLKQCAGVGSVNASQDKAQCVGVEGGADALVQGCVWRSPDPVFASYLSPAVDINYLYSLWRDVRTYVLSTGPDSVTVFANCTADLVNQVELVLSIMQPLISSLSLDDPKQEALSEDYAELSSLVTKFEKCGRNPVIEITSVVPEFVDVWKWIVTTTCYTCMLAYGLAGLLLVSRMDKFKIVGFNLKDWWGGILMVGTSVFVGGMFGFIVGALPAALITQMYASIPVNLSTSWAISLGVAQGILIIYFDSGRGSGAQERAFKIG